MQALWGKLDVRALQPMLSSEIARKIDKGERVKHASESVSRHTSYYIQSSLLLGTHAILAEHTRLPRIPMPTSAALSAHSSPQVCSVIWSKDVSDMASLLGYPQ